MSFCACMGPQRGDPYCYCEMHRIGYVLEFAPGVGFHLRKT